MMFTSLRMMEEDIFYKDVNKIGKSPGKAGKSSECSYIVAMGKGREWKNRFKRIRVESVKWTKEEGNMWILPSRS